MDFKQLKKELQRKVAMANKRVKRLEQNDMTSLPAYKYYQEMKGDEKFTSAGKDYNELRKELAKVDNFLGAKTSKVRDANKYLKGIAERTGIEYQNVKELPAKTKKFFELSSKVEQYLKNVQGSYSAIGYQKVWETVSEYVKDNDIDLGNEELDMEQYLDDLVNGSSKGKFFEDIQGTEEEQALRGNWTKMPTFKDMLKGANKLLGKLK